MARKQRDVRCREQSPGIREWEQQDKELMSYWEYKRASVEGVRRVGLDRRNYSDAEEDSEAWDTAEHEYGWFQDWSRKRLEQQYWVKSGPADGFTAAGSNGVKAHPVSLR